jgi:translation initiation factor IF-3
LIFQNAVDVLSFEQNQIRNFFKKKDLIENQIRITGRKVWKRERFEKAAKYVLQAIGEG